MDISSVPAIIMRRLDDAFNNDDTSENTCVNVDKSEKKRRKSRMNELMDKYLPDSNNISQDTSKISPQKPPMDINSEENTNESDCFKLCRPWNKQDFLARLHTFYRVYNWFAKPEYLSAVRAALTGWVNSSRDCLHCHVCHATYQHEASLADKVLPPSTSENFLQNQHLDTCPWKQTMCESAFACVPYFDDDAAQLAHITANARQLLRMFSSLSTTTSLTIVGSISLDTLYPDEKVLQIDFSSMHNNIISSVNNTNPVTNDISFVRNLISLAVLDPAGKTDSMALDTATIQMLNSLNVSFDQNNNNNNINNIENSMDNSTNNIDISNNTSSNSCINNDGDSKRLAAIAVLLSLSGWNISHTSSSCVHVHCELCQRTINFGTLKNKQTCKWDVVKQHRVHCPWVKKQNINDTNNVNNQTSANNYANSVVGWRQVSQQIALKMVAAATAAANISIYENNRKMSRIQYDSIPQENETENSLSPQVKRQKLEENAQDSQMIFHKIRDILSN